MANTDRTIFVGRDDNPLEKINSVGGFAVASDPTAMTNAGFDYFVTGYAFIYWIKLPSWFEKDGDLKYFKVMSQKFVRGFQGVTDVELQDTSQQSGFAGNESSIVTGVTRGNTDFTMSFKEASGTPITHCIKKWINYIRDEDTGVATYPKTFNCEYSTANQTGILLYIVCRPDVTNVTHKNIEKAFLYSNVYPINIPYSTLFNYELGSQESPTSVDINFKGVPLMSEAVTNYAYKILDNEILDTSDDNNNGLLFLDNLTKAGDTDTDKLTLDPYKSIYNSDDSK